MNEGYSLNEWLALFGLKVVSLVAGFVGATVGLAASPKLTPLQLVIALLGASATAAYLGPPVSYYLSIPSQFDGAIAFLLGTTGLVITAGAVEIARAMPRIVIAAIERISERVTGGK